MDFGPEETSTNTQSPGQPRQSRRFPFMRRLTNKPTSTLIAGHAAADHRVPVLLPVSNPHRAAGLATLAAKVASAYDAPVIVLYIVRTNGPSRPLPEDVDDPQSWPALCIALETLAEQGVAAGWVVRSADNVGQAIRQTAHELHARLVILGWRGRIKPDGAHINATLADVLEDPLCDVVVAGGEPLTRFCKILVPLGSGPHANLALSLALELVSSNETPKNKVKGEVTALHVVPQNETGITPGMIQKLRRSLGRFANNPHLTSKIVSANDTAQAVLVELAAGYDAVVMGTSREALIDRLLFGDVPQRVADESETTVIVTRRHSGVVTRTLRNAWQGITDLMPTLTDEEREEVHETIRQGSQSRIDFFTMIGLSAVLAALGLLLNSPAVIIGAMLVAPLMSAIVGLGLGMVEGDTTLLGDAAVASMRGALLAMGVGLVVGLLVPVAEITPEIMSRASPSVLDLGVALASGAAGAYAICRKDVSAALAGVAIAAALVPPLATVGIGVALGSGRVAGGALLLYLTNLIAIAAAGGLVFLLLGFAPPATQKEKRNVLRQGLSGAVILLVAVTVILGILTADSIRSARLDHAIKAAVQAQVATLPDAEFDQVHYTRKEDGTLQLSVAVRSSRQLPYSVVLAFQRDIATRLQQPVELLLTVIPATRLNPLIPPTLTPTLAFTATSTSTPTAPPIPSSTAPPTATATATVTPTPPLTSTPPPTATATATATPTLTPTITATAVPTPAVGVVGGTNGRGVLLRATPAGPVISALPDGAPLLVLPERTRAAGREWVHVLGPRGLTGWIAADYLAFTSPSG